MEEDNSLAAYTDAMLLQNFLAGDEASFEELFHRHYDMVYGVLFRLTGTRAEAEDLAQEVFLKLYRSAPRHADNLAGWLYRTAINTGYNALRSARRRRRREATQPPDPPPIPEAELLRHEAQQRVRRALAHLPERAASLLILRGMGFSYEEMAAIAGVAPGSVGTLLARAQRAFRRAYEEEEDVQAG